MAEKKKRYPGAALDAIRENRIPKAPEDWEPQPSAIEFKDKTPRDEKGRILPGHSLYHGNAAEAAREARALALRHAPAAIERLADIAANSENEQAAIVAADKLLDRALGKSVERAIEGNSESDGPARIDRLRLLAIIDASREK